jgi:hypothetical protein
MLKNKYMQSKEKGVSYVEILDMAFIVSLDYSVINMMSPIELHIES